MRLTVTKVLKWKAMADKLKKLKKEESDLRRAICEEVLQGQVGVVKVVINGGVKVKATGKETQNVDSVALQAIWSDLSNAEQNSIVWKPSLVAKNYKKLPSDCILNQVITTKPAMPTLKVEEIND